MRRWILNNGIEDKWDTRLTNIILNIQTDNAKDNKAAIFPSIMYKSDAFRIYSETAILTMLEFLPSYLKSVKGKMNRPFRRQLDYFIGLNIAKMSKEFKENPTVVNLVKQVVEIAEISFKI